MSVNDPQRIVSSLRGLGSIDDDRSPTVETVGYCRVSQGDKKTAVGAFPCARRITRGYDARRCQLPNSPRMGPMEISPGQARSDERRPGTLMDDAGVPC